MDLLLFILNPTVAFVHILPNQRILKPNCNSHCLLTGLWSLTYEQELTTPLHITASRGFTECLRHLLLRGARVDLAPGGTTALHEACEECQHECAKLLLQYGANANATSEDGQMPLHVCTERESLE